VVKVCQLKARGSYRNLALVCSGQELTQKDLDNNNDTISESSESVDGNSPLPVSYKSPEETPQKFAVKIIRS
jgi:hypothetical protein